MELTLAIDDAIIEAEKLFSSFGRLIIAPGRDLAQFATQADVLIIRSRTAITNALLKNSHLQFIGSTVVGLDHVDLIACETHRVPFYSAQGCNARSVAEYVITHIVDHAFANQQTFHDLTLAIIGVGHVGKQLQTLAQELGIRCLLNDPPRAMVESAFEHTDLDNCLRKANLVSLHTPLTHQGNHATYKLINAEKLSMIQPNALLINAARGGIVDESALIQRKEISLVIDAWENEPNINQKLVELTRLATPHIAGHAWNAKLRGGQMVREALAKHFGKHLTEPNIELPNRILTIKPSQSALSQLQDLLRQVYDYQQDDKVLRDNPTDTLPRHFEDYRRHYPTRYEWTSHLVKTEDLLPETAQWLTKLGFQQQTI